MTITRKTVRAAAIAGAAMLISFQAVAQQPPVTNANPKFGNLVAAQKEMRQAFNHISLAQKNNEFDFGGHAAKAKELIDQAARELDASVQFRQTHPMK